MAAQLQLVAPTVALLEGGYNLMATAAGTEAVVRVLLGERAPPLPAAEQRGCEYGMAAVAQVRCVGGWLLCGLALVLVLVLVLALMCWASLALMCWLLVHVLCRCCAPPPACPSAP